MNQNIRVDRIFVITVDRIYESKQTIISRKKKTAAPLVLFLEPIGNSQVYPMLYRADVMIMSMSASSLVSPNT